MVGRAVPELKNSGTGVSPVDDERAFFARATEYDWKFKSTDSGRHYQN
jgi:hypothetical protein